MANDPWEVLAGPTTRTPRSLETREHTSRLADWDDSVLPEVNPRDGFVHKWVRTDMMGAPDKINTSKRLRQGWEPVDVRDYPELHMYAGGESHGRVEVGGLILCRILQERIAARDQWLQNKNQLQETSSEEHYMRDPGELVKKFSENKRNIVFGQRAR